MSHGQLQLGCIDPIVNVLVIMRSGEFGRLTLFFKKWAILSAILTVYEWHFMRPFKTDFLR